MIKITIANPLSGPQKTIFMILWALYNICVQITNIDASIHYETKIAHAKYIFIIVLVTVPVFLYFFFPFLAKDLNLTS